MKKWIVSLLCCFALVFCGAWLCGCDEFNLEVKDVKVGQVPTKLTYYVGQDLQLSGGTIKVVYSDDSERFLPMTLATPNITTFKEATNNQIITLNFQGKTTIFGVSVQKGTLNPLLSYTSKKDDGTFVVSDSYTGHNQNPATHLNQQSLPEDDALQIKCYFKNSGADEDAYSEITNENQGPKNAGTYDVKLSFLNAQNYNDLDMEFEYQIYKTSVKDVVLEGNTLDYNNIELNRTQSTYGTVAQISSFWTQADGYLGEVPLPDEIKYQLDYAYRKANETSYTTIMPNVVTGSYELSLPVGEYVIKISISNNTNLNDEVLAEFSFIVVQKELTLGQDYDLYLSDGTTQTKIDENFNMTFDETKNYSLVVVSYVGELSLNDGTTYYLGNSSMGTTAINSSGQYSAEYSITGNANYKSTGRERIVFTLS